MPKHGPRKRAPVDADSIGRPSKHVPRDQDSFGMPTAATCHMLSSLVLPHAAYSLTGFCARMDAHGYRDENRVALWRLATALGLIGGMGHA